MPSHRNLVVGIAFLNLIPGCKTDPCDPARSTAPVNVVHESELAGRYTFANGTSFRSQLVLRDSGRYELENVLRNPAKLNLIGTVDREFHCAGTWSCTNGIIRCVLDDSEESDSIPDANPAKPTTWYLHVQRLGESFELVDDSVSDQMKKDLAELNAQLARIGQPAQSFEPHHYHRVKDESSR